MEQTNKTKDELALSISGTSLFEARQMIIKYSWELWFSYRVPTQVEGVESSGYEEEWRLDDVNVTEILEIQAFDRIWPNGGDVDDWETKDMTILIGKFKTLGVQVNEMCDEDLNDFKRTCTEPGYIDNILMGTINEDHVLPPKSRAKASIPDEDEDEGPLPYRHSTKESKRKRDLVKTLHLHEFIGPNPELGGIIVDFWDKICNLDLDTQVEEDEVLNGLMALVYQFLERKAHK